MQIMRRKALLLCTLIACLSCIAQTGNLTKDMSYIFNNNIPLQGRVLQTPVSSDIRLVNQMVIDHDMLYTSFSKRSNSSHDFLFSFKIDTIGNRLSLPKEYFKNKGNYYQIYYPRLFYGNNDSLRVVDYTCGNIYSIMENGKGKLSKDYLVASSRIRIPFPLTYYSADVYYLEPHKYLFIGRKADGPYEVLTARRFKDSLEIKEVRPLFVEKSHSIWDINQGSLVYNPTLRRCCYSYWMFPVIQLFDTDKPNEVVTLEFQDKQKTPKINIGADIWDRNITYFYKMVASKKYIYALYHGEKYQYAMRKSQTGHFFSYIVKMDWNGNVVNTFKVNKYLQCIGVDNEDRFLIAFDGNNFLYFTHP